MILINKTKSWFFEKIYESDKPQKNMTKMKQKRPKLVKSETKKRR
jgi:hypothetical protein